MGFLSGLLNRPKGIAVFYMAVAVLAYVSVTRIPVEGTPELRLPKLTVSASWMGASPEAMCEQVTRPIEAAIRVVEGVEEISSKSETGTCQVEVSFNPKTDMDIAGMEVAEQVAGLVDVLPTDRLPRVRPYLPRELKTRGFLIYSLSGDLPKVQLSKIAEEKIRPRLERLDGVTGVIIEGVPHEEVVIDLEGSSLRSLGLEVADVSYALRQIGSDQGCGLISVDNQEAILSLRATPRDLDDIGAVVVAKTGNSIVHMRDIATIRRGESEERFVRRYNGKNLVSLRVERSPQSNAIRLAERIQATLEEIMGELPPSIVVHLEHDDTKKIREDLADLRNRAAIGLGLILFILFLFHPSIHANLLVLSSILFSIAVTITVMYLMNLSINILTITALALGFGLMVDGAVVVSEAIALLRRQGEPALTAAIQGATRVASPVAGSILTTVVALVPLVASQGLLKIYYGPFALTVGATLAASFVVCLTLVPSLGARFAGKWERGRPFDRKVEGFFEILSHKPWIPVITAVLLVAGAVWVLLAKVEHGKEWSWTRDREYVLVSVRMPPGSPRWLVDELIQRFEVELMDEPGISYFSSWLYGEEGVLYAHLKEGMALSAAAVDIESRMVRIAAGIAGAKSVTVAGVSPMPYHAGGGGVGLQTSIELRGYEYYGLKRLAQNLADLLKTHPRVQQTNINAQGSAILGRTQHVLRPDRQSLAEQGIPVRGALSSAQHKLGGREGRLRLGDENLYLRFRVDGKTNPEIASIMGSSLVRREGAIRLADLLTVEMEEVQPEIERKNGEYIRHIAYSFLGPPRMAHEFREGIVENLELPPGFRYVPPERGFAWYYKEPEAGNLQWLVIGAMVIVYMVTATLFESFGLPLLVMLAIPLGLVGVSAGYWAFDRVFTPEAYVGSIFLVGIVVNNSILLIDSAKRLRSEGRAVNEAVSLAVRERTRPVILTTLTTIAGMLPLAVAPTKGSDLWSTIAFTAIVGLSVSTLLILSVIPAVMKICFGNRSRVHGLKGS